MKTKKYFSQIIFYLLMGSMGILHAQIVPGVYITEVDNIRHELKINSDYLTHSEYQIDPAKFIKTVGGFYTVDNDILKVKLEFNSNYETDGLKELAIPIIVEDNQLTLPREANLVFSKNGPINQALDGTWLFATRGPDKGQEHRGNENARKTLKFLQDGRFQWIAYNTDTMEFFGTGGGAFTSKGGTYTENIEYFSRDDSRVGATLDFSYQLKKDDWHHKGKNSKGEPMYEIWARR